MFPEAEGFIISGCSNITLINNYIVTMKLGIYITWCWNVTLLNNELIGGGLDIDTEQYALYLGSMIKTYFCDNNNTINGLPVIFHRDMEEFAIPEVFSFLILDNCTTVSLNGLDAGMADSKVIMEECAFITISKSSFTFDNVIILNSSKVEISDSHLHGGDFSVNGDRKAVIANSLFDEVILQLEGFDEVIVRNDTFVTTSCLVVSDSSVISIENNTLNKTAPGPQDRLHIGFEYGMSIYPSRSLVLKNNTGALGPCRIAVWGCEQGMVENNTQHYFATGGTYFGDSKNITVQNNVFQATGLSFERCSDCVVTKNIIRCALIVLNSENISCFNNELSICTDIEFNTCKSITFDNNDVSYCLKYVYFEQCTGLTVENNTISLSIVSGISGYIIHNFRFYGNLFEDNGQVGMQLSTSDFGSISNNIFNGNTRFGLDLFKVSNAEVSNNTMESNNISGMNIDGCYDLEINGNMIRYNVNGLQIYSSTNLLVSNNKVEQSKRYGIYVKFSTAIVFENNTCTQNLYGIFILWAYKMVLRNNDCKLNTYGLYIDGFDNSSILNNDFSLNDEDDITIVSSDNNTWEHNTGKVHKDEPPSFLDKWLTTIVIVVAIILWILLIIIVVFFRASVKQALRTRKVGLLDGPKGKKGSRSNRMPTRTEKG